MRSVRSVQLDRPDRDGEKHTAIWCVFLPHDWVTKSDGTQSTSVTKIED